MSSAIYFFTKNCIRVYLNFNLLALNRNKVVNSLVDAVVAAFAGTVRLPDIRLFAACTEHSPDSVGPLHSSGLDACRPLHMMEELRACCTDHQATVAVVVVVEAEIVAIQDWLVLLAIG